MGVADRAFENTRACAKSEIFCQFLACDPAVGPMPVKLGKSASGTNYGIEQPPGRQAFPEFKAVGNQALDAQMLRKRAHDVVEALADEHDPFAVRQGALKLFDALRPQPRLQDVFEVLFAEKVKTVLADATQDGMQKPRRDTSVRGVSEGARHRQDAHGAPARPSLEERLGVPREKAHGTHGRKV